MSEKNAKDGFGEFMSGNLLTIRPLPASSFEVHYRVTNDEIIVDGRAKEVSTFFLYKGVNTLFKTGNQYVLTGCPLGGGSSFWITIYDNRKKTVIACDKGNGDTFILRDSVPEISIYIRVAKDVLMDQVHFRPAVYMAHTDEYVSVSREIDSINSRLSAIDGSIVRLEKQLQAVDAGFRAFQDMAGAIGERFDDIRRMLQDVQIRTHDVQDQTYIIKDSVNDAQVRAKDVQDMYHDMKANLLDVQIRTKDVQDQTYNLKASVTDTQIRTRDVQDQTYNQKTLIKTLDKQDKLLLWNLTRKEGETTAQAKARFFRELPKQEGLMDIKQKIVMIMFKEINRICKENGIRYWLDFGTLLGAKRHQGFIPWDDDIDLAMIRADIPKFTELAGESEIIDVTQNYAIDAKNVLNLIRVKIKKYECPLFLDIFIYDFCDEPREEFWDVYKATRRKLVKETKKLKNEVGEETGHAESIDAVERSIIEDPDRISKIEEYFAKAKEEMHEKVGLTDEENQGIIFGFDNFTVAKGVRLYRTKDVFPLAEVEFEGVKAYAPNGMDAILEDRYGDIYELPGDLVTHEHFKNDALKRSLRKVYEQLTSDEQ